MHMTLRYFASIRETIGHASEPYDGTAADLAALREELVGRGAPYALALAHGRAVRMALNQVMCTDDAALVEQAEVAFFPPVTGG